MKELTVFLNPQFGIDPIRFEFERARSTSRTPLHPAIWRVNQTSFEGPNGAVVAHFSSPDAAFQVKDNIVKGKMSELRVGGELLSIDVRLLPLGIPDERAEVTYHDRLADDELTNHAAAIWYRKLGKEERKPRPSLVILHPDQESPRELHAIPHDAILYTRLSNSVDTAHTVANSTPSLVVLTRHADSAERIAELMSAKRAHYLCLNNDVLAVGYQSPSAEGEMIMFGLENLPEETRDRLQQNGLQQIHGPGSRQSFWQIPTVGLQAARIIPPSDKT